MASYFGEVTEPPSRAFWDEECDSEDDITSCAKNIRTLEVTGSPVSCNIGKIKLLLVVHGKLTEGFTAACLVDELECIAQIKEAESEHEQDESMKKEKKTATSIQKLTNDVLICTCSPDLDVTDACDFTEKLSPWMKIAEEVIVLTCSFLGEYQKIGPSNKDMMIKALKTDSYNKVLLADKLEQPNTLKGIPAGIVTWCQMSKVPAALYVCYSRSFTTSLSNMQLFSDLVSQLPFPLLKKNPNFSHRTYADPEINSNLYM